MAAGVGHYAELKEAFDAALPALAGAFVATAAVAAFGLRSRAALAQRVLVASAIPLGAAVGFFVAYWVL